MLLLVLILVVIAFGLLVVALLSGSVLWAWVSVGVSVVAAVVLLIDWLQRRASVKAGAAPAFEPGDGAPAPLVDAPVDRYPAMGRPPMADMDPATEVLPMVPSSSRSAVDPESPTVMAKAPQQTRPPDAQQTVVMPAVQPSGSPARPSGAELLVTPSGANSSQTVTGEGAARSDPAFGSGDSKVPPAAPGAAATEKAAEQSAGTSDDAPAEKVPSLRKAEKADGEDPDAPEGPPSTIGGPPAAVTTATDKAAGNATAGEDAIAGDPAGDVESTVKVQALTKNPVDSPPAAPVEDVDLFGSAPAGAHPDPEPAPVEDAPEEVRDDSAAEIVRGLDDEVVVVDEQPRYHVAGCRALVAVPVIPLPVREAVELGFTPCGWCSPDRTLAGRHQTASR